MFFNTSVGPYYAPLFNSGFTPLAEQKRINKKAHRDPKELKVVEGVEKEHASHSTQAQIKVKLEFDSETVARQTINLDSSVKYCVLVSGQVGDVTGRALDFGKGRTFDSQGVIAANKEIFSSVIEAVKAGIN
ncbi:halotolerance protein HAL2 [Candida tropicalis MYA-3404]|uniref:Halotolerance protein HAL2 n=1 Tax=Candida tropicalis (strain ATCC MYA-3404 / T1) TaxID=294747 RepID=C5M8Y2_CANTT|nr:halotolerance protein HAL2 [Candida tropicalis MYA-3404]EER34036.1 halotolerance protein HAL2 [Candida tropicalis MYA-3404]KAG4407895.1 hypothetical protein JTP64_003431 [Candida tropicalis]